MDLSLPRGINDVEPEQFRLQSKVRSSFERVCAAFNFQVMEPASLEHLGTLRVKSGQEVDKEIYAFKDKGNRDVGLRFDLTVGITRYVCSRRDLRLPAKLGAFGGIWRYDEPQYGRYRWSHQWDLEIYSPPAVGADAEVIDASNSILRDAGLKDTTIKIGDRRVVEEYIRKKLGVADQERLVELMRALDKVEKKTASELESEYEEKGFKLDQVRKLLDFGRTSGRPDSVLSMASEMHLESTDELRALADMLDSRGLKNIEYNMSVVRGIDYYTGIVFEGIDNKNPKIGSLFGGGRYDALPRLLGRPDLSATGAAGGIERIAMSLSTSSQPSPQLTYIAIASPGLSRRADEVMKELRDSWMPCETPLIPKSLSRQLDDARRLGAAWAIIIGETEVEKEGVTLRDMTNGKEELVSLSEAKTRIGHRR